MTVQPLVRVKEILHPPRLRRLARPGSLMASATKSGCAWLWGGSRTYPATRAAACSP